MSIFGGAGRMIVLMGSEYSQGDRYKSPQIAAMGLSVLALSVQR